jgi:hypothetical protein
MLHLGVKTLLQLAWQAIRWNIGLMSGSTARAGLPFMRSTNRGCIDYWQGLFTKVAMALIDIELEDNGHVAQVKGNFKRKPGKQNLSIDALFGGARRVAQSDEYDRAVPSSRIHGGAEHLSSSCVRIGNSYVSQPGWQKLLVGAVLGGGRSVVVAVGLNQTVPPSMGRGGVEHSGGTGLLTDSSCIFQLGGRDVVGALTGDTYHTMPSNGFNRITPSLMVHDDLELSDDSCLPAYGDFIFYSGGREPSGSAMSDGISQVMILEGFNQILFHSMVCNSVEHPGDIGVLTVDSFTFQRGGQGRVVDLDISARSICQSVGGR